MFNNNKKQSSGNNSTTNSEANANFLSAPHHLYYAFKIAGNLAAIRIIKQASEDPNLESLNLSNTSIDDGVIEVIIEYLINKQSSKLKELNLSGNNFTDTGISILIEAIENSPSSVLKSLVLNGNPNLTDHIISKAANINPKPGIKQHKSNAKS